MDGAMHGEEILCGIGDLGVRFFHQAAKAPDGVQVVRGDFLESG
jgi:hypothetical protein